MVVTKGFLFHPLLFWIFSKFKKETRGYTLSLLFFWNSAPPKKPMATNDVSLSKVFSPPVCFFGFFEPQKIQNKEVSRKPFYCSFCLKSLRFVFVNTICFWHAGLCQKLPKTKWSFLYLFFGISGLQKFQQNKEVKVKPFYCSFSLKGLRFVFASAICLWRARLLPEAAKNKWC